MGDTVRIYCNSCSGEKNHKLLYQKEVKWSEDIPRHGTIEGANIYELFQCCGCDRVTFRHKDWHSEDYDPESCKPVVYTRQYPPPTFRRRPAWLNDFFPWSKSDEDIADLINEIYKALQNDAPRLAVMGIRALLETIMIEKVGDKGSFERNLDAFEKDGYLSKVQKKALKIVLEAGHATIHRAYKPEKKDVVPLMDITESIIESIYMNEGKAKLVAEKIPPRAR